VNLTMRRVVWVAALVAAMPLSGWAGTYAGWRAVLGEAAGTAMAVFWDLQVESYVTALLLVGILELVYGLHRRGDGRWAVARRGGGAHILAYAGLLVLVAVCSAEGPVRDILQLALPHDIGASVAHYLRRSLEAVLTVGGLMLFLDLVRPGPFAHPTPPHT